MLDVLELIQNYVDLLTCVTAFGDANSADHFKTLLAEQSDILIKLGELMQYCKTIVDHLIQQGHFKPTERFKKVVGLNAENEDDLTKHPFSGFLSSITCLICNISYLKSLKTEEHFLSDPGFQHLGLILYNTKLDIDNPSLREWSILFVKNITSWSDSIREKLNKLTMIDGNSPHDQESLNNLEALGKPM